MRRQNLTINFLCENGQDKSKKIGVKGRQRYNFPITPKSVSYFSAS